MPLPGFSENRGPASLGGSNNGPGDASSPLPFSRGYSCDGGTPVARSRRIALADLATLTFQGLTLLVGLVLIIVLLWSQQAARARHLDSIALIDPLEWSRRPMVSAGQVALREDFRVGEDSPTGAADPGRVKSVLPAGRTYEILVKGGFVAALREGDYGVQRRCNMAYVFEMLTRRTIESNDGHRILLVLDFEKVRMVKLLSAVPDLEIELGAPGEPVLDDLDRLAPDAGIAVVDPALVARAVLGRTARAVAHSSTSRAFLETDSLSGKRVRITYKNGAGIESIQPIGCVLDRWEAQFVFHTAILADHFVFPREDAGPGDAWPLDARQLMTFLEPSIRGLPEGEVTVRRGPAYKCSGKRYCILQVEGDTLEVVSCALAGCPPGRFRPSGTVHFNLDDGHMETAQLDWQMDSAHFMGHRLLFETDFQSRPTLRIAYCCKLC